jgi:predicted transposase YbfD/YdcC
VGQLGDLKGDVVSIDGKTMRRTLDKASGASAIHLVSAWSAKNNLCFGQIKVNEKSNEITAIPLLLNMLDIKGVTITMDAMGCQFAIADKVVGAQSDYVLALKGNQGEFHEDIKLFLETNLASKFKDISHTFSERVHGDHGRIE